MENPKISDTSNNFRQNLIPINLDKSLLLSSDRPGIEPITLSHSHFHISSQSWTRKNTRTEFTIHVKQMAAMSVAQRQNVGGSSAKP